MLERLVAVAPLERVPTGTTGLIVAAIAAGVAVVVAAIPGRGTMVEFWLRAGMARTV